ncbi:uromodulin-like [Discoglossus pictus]
MSMQQRAHNMKLFCVFVLGALLRYVASNGEGSYSLTMTAYKDPSFTQLIQTGEDIIVGSPVYLSLFVADVNGDIFALRVVQCFATPSSNPDDTTRAQLVSGGCAVAQEIDTEVIKNGESLEAEIRISAFLFSTDSDMYIYCDARLCDKTSENCTECGNGRSVEVGTSKAVIPLTFEEELSLSSSVSQSAVSWAVLAGSLMAVLSNKQF